MALPCVGKFENYFRHENSHRHMWPNDMQRMVSHLIPPKGDTQCTWTTGGQPVVYGF